MTQNPYGSFNNRLMYAELRDSQTLIVLSTTYYDYTYDSTYGPDREGKSDGNVTRIITEHPAAGGAQIAITGGIETEVESAGVVEPGGGEALATQAWTTPPCRYGGLAIKEVRANVYRMLRVSPRTMECPFYPIISSVHATIPACVSPGA